MSPKRYAFINGEGTVVNVISGALDEPQLAQFLRDYATLFGAVDSLEVEADGLVWIGGSYDQESGVFSPPPISEPDPVIEEIVNGDASI